jgi:hypothetical protein
MTFIATEIPAFAGGITVVMVSQAQSKRNKASLFVRVVVQ